MTGPCPVRIYRRRIYCRIWQTVPIMSKTRAFCVLRLLDDQHIDYLDSVRMMTSDGLRELLSLSTCHNTPIIFPATAPSHDPSMSFVTTSCHFYPRDAMLARVFARATCPSVRLSVRHTPVLCRNEESHDFFTTRFCQISSQNSKGVSPNEGVKQQRGG